MDDLNPEQSIVPAEFNKELPVSPEQRLIELSILLDYAFRILKDKELEQRTTLDPLEKAALETLNQSLLEIINTDPDLVKGLLLILNENTIRQFANDPTYPFNNTAYKRAQEDPENPFVTLLLPLPYINRKLKNGINLTIRFGTNRDIKGNENAPTVRPGVFILLDEISPFASHFIDIVYVENLKLEDTSSLRKFAEILTNNPKEMWASRDYIQHYLNFRGFDTDMSSQFAYSRHERLIVPGDNENLLNVNSDNQNVTYNGYVALQNIETGEITLFHLDHIALTWHEEVEEELYALIKTGNSRIHSFKGVTIIAALLNIPI